MSEPDPINAIPVLLEGLSPEEQDRLVRQITGAAPDPSGAAEPDVPTSAAPTEIVCVVDRSGSMAAIRDDAVGGFNQFLEEQRRLPGEARLTLALFDHEYHLVYDAASLADVRPLDDTTYVPRGTTALFDAIGRTLETVARRAARPTANGSAGGEPRVLVCILTDGMENASRDYTAETVRALIESRRAGGWEFVFLAADQDAIQAAHALSIAAADAAVFDRSGAGVREAYAAISARASAYRTRR